MTHFYFSAKPISQHCCECIGGTLLYEQRLRASAVAFRGYGKYLGRASYDFMIFLMSFYIELVCSPIIVVDHRMENRWMANIRWSLPRFPVLIWRVHDCQYLVTQLFVLSRDSWPAFLHVKATVSFLLCVGRERRPVPFIHQSWIGIPQNQKFVWKFSSSHGWSSPPCHSRNAEECSDVFSQYCQNRQNRAGWFRASASSWESGAEAVCWGRGLPKFGPDVNSDSL